MKRSFFRNKTEDKASLQYVGEIEARLTVLEQEVKRLEGLNQQALETAAIMYPTEYTTEIDDNGNTVFLKNGKEKVYETIDWRNR